MQYPVTDSTAFKPKRINDDGNGRRKSQQAEKHSLALDSYPVFRGRDSLFYSQCHIGDNVKVGAGCLVKDQDVPANSLVFGQSPNLIIKPVK